MNRLLIAVLLLGGAAFAQDAPPPATEAAQAAQVTGDAADEADLTPKQITEFRAERLEALRYRHLWIAYGAIWLIIFGFVWRTWRQGNATAGELDNLRKRLAELEARDG